MRNHANRDQTNDCTNLFGNDIAFFGVESKLLLNLFDIIDFFIYTTSAPVTSRTFSCESHTRKRGTVYLFFALEQGTVT